MAISEDADLASYCAARPLLVLLCAGEIRGTGAFLLLDAALVAVGERGASFHWPEGCNGLATGRRLRVPSAAARNTAVEAVGMGLLDEVHTGRAAAAAAARQAMERLQAAPPDLLRICWTALPAPSADAALVAMGSLQPLAPRQRGGARLVRLRVDDEGLVATLELDDPARFNTMSAELGADLASRHCS